MINVNSCLILDQTWQHLKNRSFCHYNFQLDLAQQIICMKFSRDPASDERSPIQNSKDPQLYPWLYGKLNNDVISWLFGCIPGIKEPLAKYVPPCVEWVNPCWATAPSRPRVKLLTTPELVAFDDIVVSTRLWVVIDPFVDIDIDNTGFTSPRSSVLMTVGGSVLVEVITAPNRFTRFAFVNRLGLFTLIFENGVVWLVSS